MEVSNDSRLVTTNVEVRALDDRGVIVDTRSGKCWELNAVGFAIWQQIAAGRSVGETVDAVGAGYAVPADTLRADVVSFVRSLLNEGLATLQAGNDGAIR